MASEHPTYRIEKLADFLAVPPDRLAACLEEFIDWCEVYRNTEALLRTLATDHPADKPIVAMEAFLWIDDGARNITMRLSDDKGELVRVQHHDGGEPEVTIRPAPESPDV